MNQNVIPITEIKIPCECFSRVVGYFRPISHWNKGKKEEFKDRLEYKLKNTKGEKEK